MRIGMGASAQTVKRRHLAHKIIPVVLAVTALALCCAAFIRRQSFALTLPLPDGEAALKTAATVLTVESSAIVLLVLAVLSIVYTRRLAAAESEKELWRINAQRYQAAVDKGYGVVFEYNFIDSTALFSRRFGEMLGRGPSPGLWPEALIEDGSVHADDADELRRVWSEALADSENAHGELRFRHSDGRYIWFSINVSVVRDSSGRPARAIGSLVNTDAAHRAIEELSDKVRRDPLTWLLNKTAVQTAVNERIRSGGHHAMLFIDLDDFKCVNDTYGHARGDAVLVELAAVLRGAFRASDIAARVGGDEFVVFAVDFDGDKEKLAAKAGDLGVAISRIALNDEGTAFLSASIGMAFAPEDGSTYDELYLKADEACYNAKHAGKAHYAVYCGPKTEAGETE